jgi:hypothetical protein
MTRCPYWCWSKHAPDQHIWCSATTKKKKNPCPHHGDRTDESSRAVCHVHDENGQFRKNVEAARSAAGTSPSK